MTEASDIFETNTRLRFDALMIDSRVGLTFATLASEAASGSEKRIRNQANARRAYDAVLRASDDTSFTESQTQELAGKMKVLKSALEALGEGFPPS